MKLSNKRFTSRIMRVIFHLLPSRIKRLLFLSSLYSKVSCEKEVCSDRRQRLRETFDLCRDPNAISFPMMCSDRIWGSRPIEKLVCPKHLAECRTHFDVTRIARQVVAGMPCWLVYDEVSKIIDDVRHMLSMREVLLGE